MINVLDHPDVEGDGNHDDTEGLQELINDAGGTLYFPRGRYRITDTLVFPPKTGYHLIGSGNASPLGDGQSGARAAIVWRKEISSSSSSSSSSPPAFTMIEYHGSGLVWDGLSLWGRDPAHTNQTTFPSAAVGLRIKPAAGSLQPGKIWLPSILVASCETGIQVSGSLPASTCAFGFYRAYGNGVGIHLDNAGDTQLTFRHFIPYRCDTGILVEGGGRIYTQCSVLLLKQENCTFLDLQGATMANSFYHFNGVMMDGGPRDLHLLKNVDNGDGLTHLRFTNCQFINKVNTNLPVDDPLRDQNLRVLIDRSGSNSGQTVLEIVGARGLTQGGTGGLLYVLREKVEIQGASAAKPSRIIVRDCELPTRAVAELIKPGSQYFSENRLQNWLFNEGLQANESRAG